MIVFNMLMIKKLFRNNRSTFKQNSLSRKENQFTLSVMTYDAYFLFLNFPHSMYYIAYDANLYSGALVNNPQLNAEYNIMYAVSSNLAIFTQAFTIFMYVGFNKLFRQECLSVLGLKRLFRSRVLPNQTIITPTRF